MPNFINVKYNGKILTLKQWSKETGISYATLYTRYVKHLEYPEVLTLEDVFQKKLAGKRVYPPILNRSPSASDRPSVISPKKNRQDPETDKRNAQVASWLVELKNSLKTRYDGVVPHDVLKAYEFLVSRATYGRGTGSIRTPVSQESKLPDTGRMYSKREMFTVIGSKQTVNARSLIETGAVVSRSKIYGFDVPRLCYSHQEVVRVVQCKYLWKHHRISVKEFDANPSAARSILNTSRYRDHEAQCFARLHLISNR